jgi:hypothetical protein
VSAADAAPLSDITVSYVSQDTGTITPASPQTIPKASITNDIETTGYVDFTVTKGTGAGAGRVVFTASSPNRVSSTDSGDIQPSRLTGGGATPALSLPDSFWNGTNTITGTDTAGSIHLDKTTTSSSQHQGVQIKVTFAVPYATVPFVLIGSVPANSGSLDFAVGTVTTTDFTIIGVSRGTLLVFSTAASSSDIPYGVIA